MPPCIATSGWKGFDAIRKHSAAHSKLRMPDLWRFFSERLGGSAAFGGFHGSELVGIAGLLIREGQKEAHKSLLIGMYVRPSASKSGVGRRLVETIVEFARQRVELIQLSVVSDNEQARRLYERLGFREYGIEKKALKQDGRYYDE